MKKTAFIINTARGPIIDEEALVRALKAKKIAGAGLDVFELEPKVSAELKKLKNVVLDAASRQRHGRSARGDGEYRRRQHRGAARRPHAAELRQSGGVEEVDCRVSRAQRSTKWCAADAGTPVSMKAGSRICGAPLA